ncbi:YEATS-associated helix-containing protein [Sphingomonas tabacisoli]|uniref:YEATS-associated helix-containing protein n=1 Tax=Sphingomonas tabacisoli TaxID=2249466 RepID=A0ABW4I4Z8_9SPHN
MSDIWNVIAIIVVAGLVGGWAAYLVEGSNARTIAGAGLNQNAPNPAGRPLVQFLLLGAIASACVPLFLSLVKSGLVASVFATRLAADGKTPILPYEDYLVFTGLCLIAAFSARNFIESVSKQVLQKADQAQRAASAAALAATDAKEAASEAVNEVESIDENSPPPVSEKAFDAIESGDHGAIGLNDTERRVLKAMTTKTYRTRTGIAEDSGVPRDRISEILQDLHERKLALPTKSPSTGGLRWTISDRGRAAIGG